MTTDNKITFFHSPQSRSNRVRTLLDELTTPHQPYLPNMKAGERR